MKTCKMCLEDIFLFPGFRPSRPDPLGVQTTLSTTCERQHTHHKHHRVCTIGIMRKRDCLTWRKKKRKVVAVLGDVLSWTVLGDVQVLRRYGTREWHTSISKTHIAHGYRGSRKGSISASSGGQQSRREKLGDTANIGNYMPYSLRTAL